MSGTPGVVKNAKVRAKHPRSMRGLIKVLLMILIFFNRLTQQKTKGCRSTWTTEDDLRLSNHCSSRIRIYYLRIYLIYD